MKVVLPIFLVCVGLMEQADINKPPYDVDDMRTRDEARKMIRDWLPKAEPIENKYGGDPEIRLGLGILCARYASSEAISRKARELWLEVLRTDPNNKPVWATLVRRDTYYQTALRNHLLDSLECLIKNAQGRNVEEIVIHHNSRLFPLLSQEGDQEAVVVKDFDDVRKQLRAKLDKELIGAFDIVNEGQKHDPDNALYNYLKAHLYFELGNDEAGLNETKLGTQKKYLNTYFTETRRAVAKVLEVGSFPQRLRGYIEDVYAPFGYFLRDEIWKQKLEPLSREYERKREAGRMMEISELTRQIAKQIREEPLPYPSVLNPGLSQSLDQWTIERDKGIPVKSQ
jgi:hypothetical protein